MKRVGYQAVIFDFDYTLADSSGAVVQCFNAGLRGLGLPEADADEIRRTIGLSIPESLVRVAGEAYRPRAEEFRSHWRRLSDEIMIDQTYVYDHVPEALARLRAANRDLGIVSTKWRSRIEAVLERERLDHHFRTIVGGDEVAAYKPDPEGLLRAVQEMSGGSGKALYVGDSVTDAETAQRAGVDFVAVLSGTTRAEEFAAFPALEVLPSVGELPGFLASLG